MADYTPEIRQTLREIEIRGELVTYLKYETPLTNDPWANANKVEPTARYQIKVMFLNIGEQTQYLSGTLVPKGGYLGLMANNGFEPTLKGWIMRGEEMLSIKSIMTTRVNKQAIYHQIQLAR